MLGFLVILVEQLCSDLGYLFNILACDLPFSIVGIIFLFSCVPIYLIRTHKAG